MVSFRKLIKDCRRSKYRHEQDEKDAMRHRLVYHYEYPDTAQPAIFSSYCPMMPCSTLHSLRRREKEVTDWLITHFVDQFGPGKKVDLLSRSDPRLLLCVHQIFAAELRLLEVYFTVSFAWSGFERQITDNSYTPFAYTRPGLAQYYRQESLFHIGGQKSLHLRPAASQKYHDILGLASQPEQDFADAFPLSEYRPSLTRLQALQFRTMSIPSDRIPRGVEYSGTANIEVTTPIQLEIVSPPAQVFLEGQNIRFLEIHNHDRVAVAHERLGDIRDDSRLYRVVHVVQRAPGVAEKQEACTNPTVEIIREGQIEGAERHRNMYSLYGTQFVIYAGLVTQTTRVDFLHTFGNKSIAIRGQAHFEE
ncbi:Protein VAC14 [Purpureocillium lavendulum]|uniref:Protein VAC14 n=1 Tax=Purpureocillium lavendulum TaxID=1247861 RepID=A0AB34FQ22_9HYPO|nr:Protein VAC14 [Purpureocillium lavendulum]